MKARYIGIVCWMIGFLMVSCSEQEILPSVNEWESVRIYVTANNGNDVNQTATRLAYTDSSVDGKGVSVTWSSGDSFYLKGSMETLDESGNPVVSHGQMDIMEQEDEYTAIETFTGIINGKSLIDSEKVTAYYPAAAYDADNNCFKVDVRTTTQTSDNEMAHLSATNYMIGTGSVMGEAVSVSFSGGNKVAIIRFDMKIPAQSEAVGIEKFQILSEDLHTIGTLTADEASVFMEDMDRENHRQTIFLEGYTAGTSETELKVYATVLPTELKGTMTLRIVLENGNVYSSEVTFSGESNVVACNRYYIVEDMNKLVELDYKWYTDKGPDASHYTISTEGELFALANIVNGTAPGITIDDFTDQTVTLTNDVELHSDWIPIGIAYESSKSYTFNGTFDGDGHSITNLFIEREELYNMGVGFFGCVNDATIRNLTLEGQIIVSGTSSPAIGGFVGEAKEILLKNCINKVSIDYVGTTTGYVYIGGLIGEVPSGEQCILIACVNDASYLKNINELGHGQIGGIVGHMSASTSSVSEGTMVATYNLTTDMIGYSANISKYGFSYLASVSSGFGGRRSAKMSCYGCYSLYPNLMSSNPANGTTEFSFALSETDKNSLEKMQTLNLGIQTWNTTLSGSTDEAYCSHHFVQGNSHLVLEKTNENNSGTVGDMGNGGEIGKE